MQQILHRKDQNKLLKNQNNLIFRGAIFEATYNKEGKFSNTQKALLYDLPSAEIFRNFQPIKVLILLIGLQRIEFNSDLSKDMYFNKG